MNRLVVVKATWGLGRFLLEAGGRDPREHGVVVGFDGRYSSRQFAEDAAAVLAGLDIPVHIFPDPAPAPLPPPRHTGSRAPRGGGPQTPPPGAAAAAPRTPAAPRAGAIARPGPPEAAE